RLVDVGRWFGGRLFRRVTMTFNQPRMSRAACRPAGVRDELSKADTAAAPAPQASQTRAAADPQPAAARRTAARLQRRAGIRRPRALRARSAELCPGSPASTPWAARVRARPGLHLRLRRDRGRVDVRLPDHRLFG